MLRRITACFLSSENACRCLMSRSLIRVSKLVPSGVTTSKSLTIGVPTTSGVPAATLRYPPAARNLPHSPYMADHEISCILRSDRAEVHERISQIGGVDPGGGKSRNLSQAEANHAITARL